MIDKSIYNSLIKNPKKIPKLKFDEISDILSKVKTLFKKENLLLEFLIDEFNDMVYIIGDIHGNLHSLIKIMENIKKDNPKHVIFLGDLVDRGPNQLECLIYVLLLKLIFPKRYFLLKGNHETLEMNQYYGFYDDFMRRFNDETKFKEILSIYNVLPFCAVINNTILCLHGGIPEDFDIINKLKGLKPKDIDDTIFKSIANGLFQILWNDPKDIETLNFSNSFRGPGIKLFGQKAFEEFMKINNLKFLIRAHECFPEGYKWFFDKRLLSIFSSANYRGGFTPNPASYAIIKNNKIYPKVIY